MDQTENQHFQSKILADSVGSYRTKLYLYGK